MAKLEFEMPDDLLGNVDDMLEDVCQDMIKEALPIYEKSMKQSLEAHKDTGELIDSIQTKQGETKDGAYIGFITATGEKEDGFRNYQKALALEYGNSHQPATPFMQKAVNDCHDEVISKMQEVFNREVGE